MTSIAFPWPKFPGSTPGILRKEDKKMEDNKKPNDEALEEFSIMELDERLEFVAWCDDCSCKPN
jgi:hypothetical protein